MLDYLKEYGHVSVHEAPLNDVDRLIFAQMAYLNFVKSPNAAPMHALSHFVAFTADAPDSEARFDFQHKDDKALCALLEKCARFRDVRLLDFVRSTDVDTQGQFAALSLILPDGTLLIAFRGTDNTLAGWKEDFDLAYKEELPAQRTACGYVRRLATDYDAFELCGHSKGGNLALYSAVTCGETLQEKLRGALSFDGPGLKRTLVETAAFARLQPQLRVLVPHASLVGMLFDQPANVRAVHCSMPGILQHYPYSWKTRGMDFRYADDVQRTSLLLGQSLCGMLEKLPLSTRERFVEAVYEIFTAAGANTLNDLAGALVKNAPAVIRQLRGTDPETFRSLRPIIIAFWQSVAQALRALVRSET